MSLATHAVGGATARRMSRREATATLLSRNALVARRGWVWFVTAFVEPVLYLFSIGVGVGRLIPSFDVGGHSVPYAEFVAPTMLAASAMNGAVIDTTFNVFFRLKYHKLYDQVLATPMTPADIARGEIGWALIRGGIYATGFLGVMAAMGLVSSWWALLVVPASLLVSFAFAGVCMALTTWMRTWADFELITLGTQPLFLFSATFFPLSAYPTALQWFVEATPLYRGVVLCRELTTGHLTLASAVSVVYLLAIGLLGMKVVSRGSATCC